MDINNKSFRIITFNDNSAQDEQSSDDDNMSNKDEQSKTKVESEELKFIRCQHCGKLINKAKYRRHIKYHSYYTPKTKKLKIPVPPRFVPKPKFKMGTNKKKYFMCKVCDVCVGRKNVYKHLCSEKSRKRQCPKCHLWFRDTSMQFHTQYHEKYKLTRNNFDITYFKNGKVLKGEKVIMDKVERKESTKANKMVLYQCKRCKLCMINHSNIYRHKCHTQSKMCELCEVPFHSSHFVFHKRLHETKSFSKTNLHIIEMEPRFNITTKLQTKVKLKTKLNTQALVKNLKVKKGNVEKKVKLLHYYKSRLDSSKRKVNFELMSPSFLKRIHTSFYRCHICSNLFVTLSSMLAHVRCCLGDEEKGTKCDTCGLVFHASALITHKKWQKCSNILEAKKLYYLSIRSKNVVTFDITRCVYACAQCDICYMTLNTVFRHSDDGHNMSASIVPCDKCDLRFSKLSNTKHNRLHHELQNLSSSELIVLELEIAKPLKHSNPEKKVVGDDEKDCDNDTNGEENQDSDNKEDHVDGNEEDNVNDEDNDNDNEEDHANETSEEIYEKTANYELSEKTYIRRIHTHFYKCHVCDSLFVTLSSMFEHVKRCDGSGGVTCSGCGLMFHLSSIDVHKGYQKCNNILGAKLLYMISVASKNIDVYDDGRIIFSCQRCDICYLTLESMMKHFEKNHNVIKSPLECMECNLKFSKISHLKHQKLHHEAQGLSASDVIVLVINTMRPSKLLSVGDTDNDMEEEPVVRRSIKRKSTRDISASEGDDSVASDEEVPKGNVSLDKYEITNFTGRYRDKRINTRFYQCHICDNLFVTLSNLFEHVTSCTGDDGVKCGGCGFIFDSTAIEMHKWQKCSSILEAKALHFLMIVSKNVDPFDVSRTVFMCRQCDICYLTLNTLFFHIETNHSKVMVYGTCEICGLPFSQTSNTKHKKLHHMGVNATLPITVMAITGTKYQEGSENGRGDGNDVGVDSDVDEEEEVRKTIKRKYAHEDDMKRSVVKKSKVLPAVGENIFKCDICNLHFLQKRSLRNHKRRVVCHNMKGVNCPICHLGFAKKSLKRHLETHDEATNDEVRTATEAENYEVNVGDEKSVRLFKCSACDVYFLTDDVCRDHVEDHHDLDPTEYIACKICDLQFLCEYLGGHMRSHRESNFNIDEVVVTEYQPNKVVGDTYLAVDRLKSKLVTTTTHFDTEDEKGESVDSSDAR